MKREIFHSIRDCSIKFEVKLKQENELLYKKMYFYIIHILTNVHFHLYSSEKVASAQRELSALMKPLKCDLCNAVVRTILFNRIMATYI